MNVVHHVNAPSVRILIVPVYFAPDAERVANPAAAVTAHAKTAMNPVASANYVRVAMRVTYAATVHATDVTAEACSVKTVKIAYCAKAVYAARKKAVTARYAITAMSVKNADHAAVVKNPVPAVNVTA